MVQKRKRMMPILSSIRDDYVIGTIEDLADITRKGFVRIEKKIEKKIDDLAGMTQRGFMELENRMNGKFTGLDAKIDKVANDLANLAETNASGHLDIKSRLDNTANRFEVVELEKRVDILEKKDRNKGEVKILS